MTQQDSLPRIRQSLVAYACIGASIALVLFLGAMGVYRDIKLLKWSLLHAEVVRVKSHANRLVGRIEHELEQQASGGDLLPFRDDTYIRDHWREMGSEPGEPQRSFFAGIVDPGGRIIAHSNQDLEDRRLERDWYDSIVENGDRDVYRTRSSALSDGKPVYDVPVPIEVGGEWVGEYHTGFASSWFDDQLEQKRGEILGHWSLLFAGILLIVFFATISLYFIAKRFVGYRRALGLFKLQRAAEMGQLAGGLVHEIRNPLHAIRLNVHTLARELAGTAHLTLEDRESIVQQTNQEIERVDGLLQQLLGFARPEELHCIDLDIVEEVRSTLRFVHDELEQCGIEVREDFPSERVMAHVDPDRFRQIMLNLLVNAKDAMDGGGNIELQIRHRGKMAEVSIHDDGPGIDVADCERIFEPFFSTKDQRAGMGLALTRRFVEDLDGEIWCEAGGNGTGTTFFMRLPRGEERGS